MAAPLIMYTPVPHLALLQALKRTVFAVVDRNDFGTPGKLEQCKRTLPVLNNEIRKLQNLPPLKVCNANEFKNGDTCIACKSLCTQAPGTVGTISCHARVM